jgi:hypothetical protein
LCNIAGLTFLGFLESQPAKPPNVGTF